MSAPLNPDQFVVDMGTSPLSYNRVFTNNGPQRLTLRHPDAGTPSASDTYIVDTSKTIRTGSSGQRLKKPRIEKVPGAGENAAGFVDYEDLGDQGLKIHYIRTAKHLRNSGIAQRAIDELIKVKNPTSINFGKLVEPASGRVMEKAQKQHPDIQITGSKNY